jgi:hypothetical protein
MSDRASTLLPSACSGAMYAAVPRIAPISALHVERTAPVRYVSHMKIWRIRELPWYTCGDDAIRMGSR